MQREDDHLSLFAHFTLGVLLVSNKTCCSLHYILAAALSDPSSHYCVCVCELERAVLFCTLGVHPSVSILKRMHCFTDSFKPMCIHSPAHQHRRKNQCVFTHPHTNTHARTKTHTITQSDISSIDHLALREFVSGPPRYHLAIKGVREQFVIVEQNSGP